MQLGCSQESLPLPIPKFSVAVFFCGMDIFTTATLFGRLLYLGLLDRFFIEYYVWLNRRYRTRINRMSPIGDGPQPELYGYRGMERINRMMRRVTIILPMDVDAGSEVKPARMFVKTSLLMIVDVWGTVDRDGFLIAPGFDVNPVGHYTGTQ